MERVIEEQNDKSESNLKRGRGSIDAIHNFFSFDSIKNVSTCRIGACSKELQGKKPSNLRRHVQTIHKDTFMDYLTENDKKKMKLDENNFSMIGSQANNNRVISKYAKQDKIQKNFMENMISLVATSSISLSLVDKNEFVKMIFDIDPKINIPGRKSLVNGTLQEFSKSQIKIKNILKNTYGITIGADIWSKKGLSESYISVTAHCISSVDNKKKVICLVLKLFPYPHTAERVKDSIKRILNFYEIHNKDIVCAVTDNGSNMVKAFKIKWESDDDSDEKKLDLEVQSDEVREIDTPSQNTGIMDRIPIDFNDMKESEINQIFDQNIEQILQNGNTEIEGNYKNQEIYSSMDHCSINTNNQDLNCNSYFDVFGKVDESDFFVQLSEEQNIEVDDNHIEDDLNRELKRIQICRVPCAIHVLQRVIHSTEKKSPFKNSIRKALDLIKFIRSSGKRTEKIIEIAGKKLPTITPTRWNSLYLQLESLVSIQAHVAKLCENRVDNLLIEQWNHINLYIQIYKPFNDMTNEFSKQNITTSSKVIPWYLYLRNHLVTFNSSNDRKVTDFLTELKNELEKRFKPFVNPNNNNNNSKLFLAATFLDPRYHKILDHQQMQAAKNYMISLLEEKENEDIPITHQADDVQASKLSAFDSFIMQNLRIETRIETMSAFANLNKQFLEFIQFINQNNSVNMELDPVTFWLKTGRVAHLNELMKITLKVLAVPCSTATVERIFSLAGYACLGRNNRLSEKRLEMLVLLKANSNYLDKI